MDERGAELAAMATSSEAIEPLTVETRRRVVRWLADVFDVELTPVAASVAAQGPPPAPSASVRRARGRKKSPMTGSSASPGQAPSNKPKAAPGFDKTLNLHPADKVSFSDFVAEKAPRDNFFEHNVVAAYWLALVAELEKVTADQIFTCYRGVSWKLPNDLRNSLQQVASKKGWLDTSDTDDIKLAPQGLNFIDLELPRKKK